MSMSELIASNLNMGIVFKFGLYFTISLPILRLGSVGLTKLINISFIAVSFFLFIIYDSFFLSSLSVLNRYTELVCGN